MVLAISQVISYNNAMKKAQTPTSFYLSDTARRLLREIARFDGISMSAILELAIRTLARQRGILKDASEITDSKN